jgi:hypothetical protein
MRWLRVTKYKLSLELEWILDVPELDGVDTNEVDLENELLDMLSERIALGNETVENLFWEGIIVKRID